MKLLPVLLLMSLPVSAPADDLGQMISRMESGSTVCFKFEVQGRTSTKGDAIICGGCYHATLGTTEVYCDSTTRWTVDREAKELYLEKADGAAFFWSAPELFLPDVKGLTVSDNEIRGIYKDSPFRIHSILWLQKMPEEAFRFDARSLPADWVTEDLRL